MIWCFDSVSRNHIYIPFQTGILYVASSHSLVVSLHITLHPCLPFVLSWLFHTLFPPSFQSTLSSVCSLVIIAHYNMCSISLKTPKDNSYFVWTPLWETFWQRQGGNREWKGNEWGNERENYFIVSGEGLLLFLPFPSCTYLQNEFSKKACVPFFAGFAPRYKVAFFLRCAERFPLFNITDAKKK